MTHYDFPGESGKMEASVKSACPTMTDAIPATTTVATVPPQSVITRCAVRVVRRASRPLRIKFPYRRMLLAKLHPKQRRMDTSYFDYHTRGEIL